MTDLNTDLNTGLNTSLNTDLDTDLSPATVEDICLQFSQEGLTFEVQNLDLEAADVRLRLVLDDVECTDCVVPAEYLERMIAESIERRTGRPVTVGVLDPRRAVAAPDLTAADSTPGQIVVLDPTVAGKGGEIDPGPPAGPLAGKTVLFRVDPLWRSWDWTVDVWSARLREAGATVTTWRRWQGISGDEGDRRTAEYQAAIASADIVISGLANCGSCSAWTIRDALIARETGVPTMAVVTEHFVPLAKLLAEDGGYPGLRMHVLPYPYDLRPEHEVRAIAGNEYESMLADLGARADAVGSPA